jgi:hypothetical protein
VRAFAFGLGRSEQRADGRSKTSRASKDNPQYQVRLYCTSEDHFTPNRPPHASALAPTDFPGTCELKLNGFPVQGNTKGIKKVAGSAPPVDLTGAGAGKAFKLAPGTGTSNRVEVVYVNTDKVSRVCLYSYFNGMEEC